MEEEKQNNKGVSCLGQIIIAFIIIAVVYGAGDFLKANKGFSIVLSVLVTIWFLWKWSKK